MSCLHRIAAIVFMTSLCILLMAKPGSAQTETDGLRIDAGYPGGNIIVDRIEGDQVSLRQDLRDTNGWWFYWNFRVRGAAGRTLTFHFDGQSPIGVRGPAGSTDGGHQWSWLGAKCVQGASFTHRFDAGVDEVRFSFAIPYVESHLQRFLAAYQGNRCLSVQTLCKTRRDALSNDCRSSIRIVSPAIEFS